MRPPPSGDGRPVVVLFFLVFVIVGKVFSVLVQCYSLWVGPHYLLNKAPNKREINSLVCRLPEIRFCASVCQSVCVCALPCVFAGGRSSWWAHSMGMQSLRSKLRKRKYKLSLSAHANGGTSHGATAFSNAGSEWEFENFSPWIFTRKPVDADDDYPVHQHFKEMDEEDERYWAPARPLVQGLVGPPAPLRPPPAPPLQPQQPQSPSPLTTTAQQREQKSEQHYGILSYFPRRPSSWSPTSTIPPPVPPHAWQLRRQRPPSAAADNQHHHQHHDHHNRDYHQRRPIEENREARMKEEAAASATAAAVSSSSSSRHPRRKATTPNDVRVVSISSSQIDLRRSASCYQDTTIRGATSGSRNRMSETDLRLTGLARNDIDSVDEDGYYCGDKGNAPSSYWANRNPFSRPPSVTTEEPLPLKLTRPAADVAMPTTSSGRVKRVQSELARGKQPLRPLARVEPIYSQPMRRTGAIGGANLRPFHNGLKSTLASSESNLSGSYTLLNDDIDRRPPPPHPVTALTPAPVATVGKSASVHRSPIERKTAGRSPVKSPSPPPVPAHAPGVFCTRIVSPSPINQAAASLSFSTSTYATADSGGNCGLVRSTTPCNATSDNQPELEGMPDRTRM